MHIDASHLSDFYKNAVWKGMRDRHLDPALLQLVGRHTI